MSTYTNVVKSAIIGLLALGATAVQASPEQSEGFDDNDVFISCSNRFKRF